MAEKGLLKRFSENMDNKDISIIIVNWNAGDYLRKCLSSIRDSIHANIETIVVDNNSTDGSPVIIKKEFPWVRLTEQTKNHGYAKANNIGFKLSASPYILILNPDTVVEGCSIEAMLDFLKRNPGISIIGPRLIDGTGRMVMNCKKPLPSILNDFFRLFLIEKLWHSLIYALSNIGLFKPLFFSYYDKSEDCESVEGSCMLIRREVYETLGGFSEDLPMFLDDYDICYRCRNSGGRVYYLAEATVVHFGQRSAATRIDRKLYDIMAMQARLFYYRKHYGPGKAVMFRAIVFFSAPYLIALDFLTLPYYLLRFKLNEKLWVIRKHFKYFEIALFPDKIVNMLG
jgi:GT2 family glycosyltransferase